MGFDRFDQVKNVPLKRFIDLRNIFFSVSVKTSRFYVMLLLNGLSPLERVCIQINWALDGPELSPRLGPSATFSEL